MLFELKGESPGRERRLSVKVIQGGRGIGGGQWGRGSSKGGTTKRLESYSEFSRMGVGIYLTRGKRPPQLYHLGGWGRDKGGTSGSDWGPRQP